MALVSYTFELDEDYKEALEKIAAENYRTLAGQLRHVIEEYVEQNRKKNK